MMRLKGAYKLKSLTFEGGSAGRGVVGITSLHNHVCQFLIIHHIDVNMYVKYINM